MKMFHCSTSPQKNLLGYATSINAFFTLKLHLNSEEGQKSWPFSFFWKGYRNWGGSKTASGDKNMDVDLHETWNIIDFQLRKDDFLLGIQWFLWVFG